MSSYTVINAKTMANIVTIDNSKEQKWVLNAHVESLGTNPFTDLIGGYQGGKPIIEVMDTRKIAGDTINLTRLAPLAGPGRQGEASRDGQEEKYRFANYQFTIGRLWNGTAQNTVARDQTVIGSNFDKNANKLLGEWMGWRKGNDVEMEMVVKAHSRNTVRPLGAANREALRTSHYLQSETVSRAKNALASLQAKSLKVAKSKSGSVILSFLLVANQYALMQFKLGSLYTTILSNAGVRGDTNELFTGALPDWNGTRLWEWQVPDHCGFGPIGSVCLARAVLGVAITAANTAQDIQGGGSAEGAALLTPLYFQNFSGAAYQGFNEVKQIAVTNVDRYVLIANISGSDTGKFGFYNYQTNNGNKLTMAARVRASASGIAAVSIGGVAWASGPWSGLLTDSHPVGSLIYETNSSGVPFCYSYMLADEAIMSGYGSIDGSVSAMGKRTEAIGPHGLDYGVGLEACWGCKAIPRVDGLVNGYVLIESAYKVDGMPDVT